MDAVQHRCSERIQDRVEVGQTWVGDPFPPITRLALALYCGASGDHNPLHVDLDAARAAGFEDVIAHGMLPMAYLGRFVTELFGQEALGRFAVRFTNMTRVGDTLTCSATCVATDPDARVATLELSIADADGQIKASGQAEVRQL